MPQGSAKGHLASQQPGPTLFYQRDKERLLAFKASEERLPPLKEITHKCPKQNV